ncbi:MAG: bifunctional riboflavin kinase/FAD synthetase [Aristaeellaceae bacterium]
MMHLLRNPTSTKPCVLVLGMFDGVHRGHQRLLMQGVELSEAEHLPLNVCTFEPHPLQVLRPEKAPPLLTTLTERAGVMATFGVDNLCVHTFNRAMADQDPEDYLAELVRTYQPRHIVCGFNFTFGKGGQGDGEMLAAYGQVYGYETHIVPEVMLDGATVSSTRIRALLAQGDIRGANRLLGHAYTLSGRVEDGKHIGRTMGFPTANVRVPAGKALPAYGVYACWLQTAEATYPAVMNVGRHPTLPEGHVTVEAYVLDACLQLYGKKVRLSLMNFQRPERRFDDVEELKNQIAQDARDCRAYFDSLN